MRRLRNVKIVATLGPASSSYESIKDLYEAGADVFRLNMSHGSHEDVSKRHEKIRKVEEEIGRPIGILADLQGPKLRCGDFANKEEELKEGQSFRFDLQDSEGDSSRVTLPHPEIFNAVKPGSSLLVADGQIRLTVKKSGKNFTDCVVISGGTISNRKGVNVPDVVLPVKALSEKDRNDLEFVCSLGVDWLALSFVQRPEDVIEARNLANGRASILSKIEKPAAVNNFGKILEVSDGIMIARGDLGVELPVQELPPIQKRLVRACRKAAKPVIVATQMLESMITSPVPTRAEVSDVATAIYEGADAIMLSAESAIGDYPVEAVETMDKVAKVAENDTIYRNVVEASRTADRETVADAITTAAREVAETTSAKAICCFTHSGTTAYLAARERSQVPLIALTPLLTTARRLSLTWGAHCVVTEEVDRFKMAVVSAAKAATAEGFATIKDFIVVTAGVPFNVPGSTNILRVAPVDVKKIFREETP